MRREKKGQKEERKEKQHAWMDGQMSRVEYTQQVNRQKEERQERREKKGQKEERKNEWMDGLMDEWIDR